jgi:hypothetical protein
MAEYTYTVTVASGDLYGGGTGNVYYLDGSRNSTGPGTVQWVEDGTLRFEQSDASNNNHPLIFSTTTSRDQYLTSGVTYYLDGAVTYSQYTNTTTFNAATTRYVEVTPSSQTDFYYLCYVHGIGMGGIFDITQSTWGAFTWGQGNYGAQNSQSVSVTGIASALALGTQTMEANTIESPTGIAALLSVGDTSIDLLNNGWGANTWGFSEWGQIGNLVTGQALTTAVGSETVSIDVVVSTTGQSLSTAIGNEVIVINQTIAATGQSLTSAIGILDPVPIIVGSAMTSSIGNVTAVGVIEVGWGGDAWGLNQWGELNAPTEAVTTAGLLQTTAAAVASITANADIAVTGIALTTSIGNDTSGTSHIEAVTTAGLLQMSSESSVVDIGVPVTGISSSMSAGQTTIDPTFLIGEGWGRDTWGNLGWGVNFSAQNTAGLALTSSIGNEATIANADVAVTGQALTSSFGTFSVKVDQDISITVSEHTLTTAITAVALDQDTTEVMTGLSMTLSLGNEEAGLFLDVPVTGSVLTSAIGSSALVQTTIEAVTGQALTSSIGTIVEVPQVIVGVSGVAMSMSLGSEGTVSNANAFVTGQSLTSSIGSPNITPWQEVDLGVNNTWTTVDLAA